VTVAVAIAAIFMLPDHPLTTRWLTEDQRLLAHSRMERDTVGLQESRGAIAGFKQALTDPRLGLFVLFQTLHMYVHVPVSNFGTLISQGRLWF